MPSLNLPALTRAKGVRRASVTLRPIVPTKAQATDLAQIIAPAWQVWREAEERIMAGYDPAPLPTGDSLEVVPEKTASDASIPAGFALEQTRDGMTLDSAAAIDAAIGETAAEFLRRLVTTVTPGLRRWSVRLESWHRGRWVSAVSAATGVDLGTVLTTLPTQDTLEVWLSRNVALVQNISDQAQARISDAIWRGYQERRPARDVAKDIGEATDLSRKRALFVASDQTSKLSAQLDDERMAEAGLELWKYRHSGKLHPRSWHKARDGRIYTLRGNKQVNADGSPMSGGDVIEVDDAPGRPPRCACRKQGYLALFAEIE